MISRTRKWFGGVVLGVAFLAGVPDVGWGQGRPNATALEEAKGLARDAIKLYRKGKYDEAIPLAELALAIREEVLGRDHPDVATSLNNLAVIYDAKGDYTRAEQLYQRSVAIREKFFGKDHPEVASVLNNLAGLYQAKGDYARAEPYHERALAIQEKALGNDHLDVASSLNALAELYRLKGDYVRAEPLQLRALAIRERALGKEHPVVASSLNNLGLIYHAKADYAHAEPLYLRAIGIWEALEKDHPDVADTLNNLAELYRTKGDYTRAQPLYQRALAIEEKALGKDHPRVATSLNNLAILFHTQGNYAHAELLYLRALAIREKALGKDHPDVANSLNNLAKLYKETGEYTRAEPLYQKALAIRETTLGKNHPDVARSLNNLAELYRAKGDYAHAQPLYQRALAIRENFLGKDHPDVASSLNNLATLYMEMGDSLRAESLYQRALAIVETVLGRDHPYVASSLNNLAVLYESNGNHARAEPLYQRALTIAEVALGKDHPHVASSLNNLAILHFAKGDYAQAEKLLQQALSICEKALGPLHPAAARNLENLSAVYLTVGNLDAALSSAQRTATISDANLTQHLVVGTNEQRRMYMETLRESTHAVVSLHLQSAPQRDDAKSLAFRAILRRKGLTIDAMSNSFVNLRERLSPNDQIKFDNWRVLTTQYSAMAQRGPGKEGVGVFRTLLEKLNEEREKAENELNYISKDLQAQLNPVTIEQMQSALPKHTALVELFQYRPFNPRAKATEKQWGTARFVAYVLHPNGHIDFADLGDAKPIEDAAKVMRDALSRDATDPKPAARRLHQLVMAPIQKLLGQTRHIYLSPDGALNLVPFDALVDKNAHYVVESFAITYLLSGRDLVRRINSAPSRQAPTVFAGPDYEAGSKPETALPRQYTPLLYARNEANTIAAFMPGTSVREGAGASEAALKALYAPKILHIATHGFFEKDLPALHETPRDLFASLLRPLPPAENALLRSGLVFAGANRSGLEKEDGLLTALEASQLDLWGTKLVVLSACDTGNGQAENGDGVYGLRRAFSIAGAETVVMSLWQVDGRVTTELMKSYYEGLSKGGGRAEALRQAQLAMLDSNDHSHPYYWASFIASGDDRSMEGRPVERTFGRVNRAGTCGACEIGAYETNGTGVWLGIVALSAAMRLRRRSLSEENAR